MQAPLRVVHLDPSEQVHLLFQFFLYVSCLEERWDCFIQCIISITSMCNTGLASFSSWLFTYATMVILSESGHASSLGWGGTFVAPAWVLWVLEGLCCQSFLPVTRCLELFKTLSVLLNPPGWCQLWWSGSLWADHHFKGVDHLCWNLHFIMGFREWSNIFKMKPWKNLIRDCTHGVIPMHDTRRSNSWKLSAFSFRVSCSYKTI